MQWRVLGSFLVDARRLRFFIRIVRDYELDVNGCVALIRTILTNGCSRPPIGIRERPG